MGRLGRPQRIHGNVGEKGERRSLDDRLLADAFGGRNRSFGRHDAYAWHGTGVVFRQDRRRDARRLGGHFERNRHAGGRTRLGRQFAFRHYRDSAEGRLGRILQRHLQHGQRELDDRRRRPGGMGHWLTSRVHGRPEDRSFSRIGGPRMPPADKRRRPACHRLEQQLHPASRLWQDDHRDNRGRVGVRVQQRNIHDSVKRFEVPESSRGPSCH